MKEWNRLINSIVLFSCFYYISAYAALLALLISMLPINKYVKEDYLLSLFVINISLNFSIIALAWLFFLYVLSRAPNLTFKHWIVTWIIEKLKGKKQESSSKKNIWYAAYIIFINMVIGEANHRVDYSECMGGGPSTMKGCCESSTVEKKEINLSPKEAQEEGQIESNKALQHRIGERTNVFEDKQLAQKQTAFIETMKDSTAKIAEGGIVVGTAAGSATYAFTKDKTSSILAANIAAAAKITESIYYESKEFRSNYHSKLNLEEGFEVEKIKNDEESKQNE